MFITQKQVARRFGALLALLLTMIAAGSIAFSLVQGVSVGFGLVWTLDTITTMGTVPQPHDTGGRLIIICLELVGIGTLFYGLATVAEFFVSGHLSVVLETRRNNKMIDSFKDHYVVCGYGRVGRQVARDLKTRNVDVVVIDRDPTHQEQAKSEGMMFIDGSPAEDATLHRAGIERASAVVACVDSDAENIFISLSARELRPEILIIARASAEDSEKKLLRAGADRVISPYKTTGSEMARIALHPQVGGAVDVADYRVEEIEVPLACAGLGRTVGEVRGNSVIVALRRHDGSFEAQPPLESVVAAGDRLVTLGTPEALEAVEAMFQPVAPA